MTQIPPINPQIGSTMNRRSLPIKIILTTIFVLAAANDAPPVASADRPNPATVTRTLLQRHCVTCHGGDEPDGKLSLEELSVVSNSNAKVWQRVLTQLSTGEMPPDGEPRPKLADREVVIAWIVASMKKAGIEPQSPGGPLPSDGNLIDHARLFSGHFKGPAYSPPRFWRRSQSQYDALMERLWVIPKLRYEKTHRRSDPEWAGYSYSQPFPGLDPAHFTDFSGEIHADEAVLKALIDAGNQIAERLTSDKTAYAKELQPPHAVGIPSIRRGSDWERFKLEPPARPQEFEPFLVGRALLPVKGATANSEKKGTGKSAHPTSKQPTAAERHAAVRRVFQLFLNRDATDGELQRYGGLLNRSIEKSGSLAALRGLITAVIVSPEFVFRMEVGMGPKDKHARRMLSPNELVYAIAYALTDDGPDDILMKAARSGKLQTKMNVEREVRRILADDSIEKHGRLRFFQEFFGYHRALDVFKDQSGWPHEAQYLIRDADMLVEHILKQDRNVFAELLTSDRYFVAYPNIKDPKLFEAIIQHTIDETKTKIDKIKQRGRKIEPNKNGGYSRTWAFTQGRALIPRTVHNDRGSAEMSYIRVYGIDGNAFEWTPNQPIEVPGRRAGILTHPAWLVAHSTNFDNDVVGRGHWIREHLLAGKIPDVPIDVEAMVPDEPDSTLRHRMRVTRADRCIRCHRRMDPLGLPFEIYDHYGHFRKKEMVGTRKNQPKPINATGAIIASGDEKLDGPIKDAIDLVHKLAKSPRVRQSFVRHAFRYWMGRNEMLSDSPTLIAADNAYVQTNGSFTELLVSLLTSDSFLYRK